MNKPADRAISLSQAARTLFGTNVPSDEQIYYLIRHIKSGSLAGRDGGSSLTKWATTEAALAEFMASERVEKRRDIQSRPPHDREESAALRTIYRGVWRDYFLSLMLSRRMANRGAAFRRAVLAGQVILLIIIAGVALGAARQITRQATVSPEHLAVEEWIFRNTDEFAIEHWHPTEPSAEGEGTIVAVEYRYRKESQRWIHTKRTFLVSHDGVRELIADE